MQHLISLLHHTKEPHGLFLASLTGASVDITASKKQYEIDVDVPGADVNDVVLELYDDRLSVTTKWPQVRAVTCCQDMRVSYLVRLCLRPMATHDILVF